MPVSSRSNFNKLIVSFASDKVSKLVDAAPKAAGSAVNQLLGIKGASAETVGWEMGLCDV